MNKKEVVYSVSKVLWHFIWSGNSDKHKYIQNWMFEYLPSPDKKLFDTVNDWVTKVEKENKIVFSAFKLPEKFINEVDYGISMALEVLGSEGQYPRTYLKRVSMYDKKLIDSVEKWVKDKYTT